MAEVHTGADSLVLWESASAEGLVDAHLLENGRLGAAIFGSLPGEKIVISEDTLWSGAESFLLNPDTRALLQEARRLVFERKFAEAHRLVAERMLGGWGQAYEPLGRTARCSQGCRAGWTRPCRCASRPRSRRRRSHR